MTRRHGYIVPFSRRRLVCVDTVARTVEVDEEIRMETSPVSSNTLLDLWGLNDDDIQRYRICREVTRLNESLSCPYKSTDLKEDNFCIISSLDSVCEKKANVSNNVARSSDHCAQNRIKAPTAETIEDAYFNSRCSPANCIKSIENNAVGSSRSNLCLQMNLRGESEAEGWAQGETIDICDYCHRVNKLKLSWCENCGRAIKKDKRYQEYSSHRRNILNCDTQILDCGHYGNTQTNFNNTITSRCTWLQAQDDCYQRHWKKSSYYSWMKPQSSLDVVNNKVDQLISKLLMFIILLQKKCTIQVWPEVCSLVH